jgi:predicted transcriptional regulator
MPARYFSGTRLRNQRRLAGLSVHDVAARVGRSCWSVYAYERGQAQPPLPVADALATAVGLPLERFLTDDMRAA